MKPLTITEADIIAGVRRKRFGGIMITTIAGTVCFLERTDELARGSRSAPALRSFLAILCKERIILKRTC